MEIFAYNICYDYYPFVGLHINTHSFQEEYYGRPLVLADRELCEGGIDDILQEASDKEVALLVVGDPLGATTHTDMLLRAKQMGVKTQVNYYFIFK